MSVVHVNQWGASLGVRLPKAICQHLAIEKDTALYIQERQNKIVIEVVRPKKSLAKLVAKITDENSHENIFDDDAQGKEVW